MQRKHGRLLGYLCLGTGVTCTVYGFSNDRVAEGLLACCVFVGLGTWLLNRLYLGDPEAIKEYRESLQRSPLSESLRKFSSCENILQFSSRDEVSELLWKEARAFGPVLSPLVNLYGTRHVRSLLQLGVVEKKVLRDRMDCEVARVASFTALWHSFRDNMLQEALFLVGTDPSPLRTLFLREYDWVDENGQLIPSAPQAESRGTQPAAGAPLGVYRALATYSEFVTKVLGVSPQMLSTIIETCPFAQQQSLSGLLNEGLMELHRLGLVRPHWVEGKLTHEVQLRRMDLWTAESQFGLKHMISSGLVSAQCAAELITSGIPTTASPRLSKENNIIHFIQYWRDVLERHPSTVTDRRLANAMMETFCDFLKLQRDVEEKLLRLRRKAAAARENQKAAGQRRAVPSDVDQAFSLPEARAIRESFETQQIDMHNAFCRSYAAAAPQSSGGPAVSLKTNDFEFNVNLGQNKCPQM